jgi:hypothetical protein
VPYETRGLESVEPYSFDQYFGARVQQSQIGATGPDAVPVIAYSLGGKGNGSNAPPLYKPEYKIMSPHVGFAWNVGSDKKTVINGSAGVIYDRSVIFAIQSLQDSDSYLFQQTKSTPFGIPRDPYNSIKTDPRLDPQNGISNVTLTPPATPRPPYEPFTDPSFCDSIGATPPCGLQDGLAFNETIDPTLKTPYSIMYNFGVQRSIPGDMIIKANYVGRLGRRLLAQTDAEQIIDFPDSVSGQLFSEAFGEIVKEIRADPDPTHVQLQPWFENVVAPGIGAGAGYANNTQFLASVLGGLFQNGDFADFNQAISSITPQNVGMATQFSENSFHDNQGFSSYNGLLLSLQKNLSHGLQYDLNYTWSHSIDNTSYGANSIAVGGYGFVCDVLRPRACVGNSDFDVTHYINGTFIYELPVGHGRQFASSAPFWLNEVIGGWNISGLPTFHTGNATFASSSAFVAGYANDAPAILTGSIKDLQSHVHKDAAGTVWAFKESSDSLADHFVGPIGFQVGSRNNLRGPHYFNMDLGLGKTFPIVKERVKLVFRADAYNAFNHANFLAPDEQDNLDITGTNGIFGVITGVNSNADGTTARVLQGALRLEF